MKVTLVVATVLTALLGDSDRRWYGLELMRETGLPSGTLYPVLARMEAEGWLMSEREDEDAHRHGRPRRRYYTLTDLGRSAGAAQLTGVRQRLQPAPSSPSRSLSPVRPGIIPGVFA